MQASDVLALVRVELGEPDPTGRWSDTDLLTLLNTAQRAVGLRLEFPEATITPSNGLTTANVQEYALPEVSAVLRVYVGGQLLTPTTIGNLEGDNLEMWDMSAPTFQPQWIYLSQTSPTSYPVGVINGGNYPVGTSMPWSQGNRPQWYQRGGNIGLMPPPSNAATFIIDVVPVPTAVASLQDQMDFPFAFQEALAWKVCHLAHKADNDDEQANYADTQWEKAVALLATWKRRQSTARPFQLILFPERAKWKGPVR